MYDALKYGKNFPDDGRLLLKHVAASTYVNKRVVQSVHRGTRWRSG
jgi:hypothetical protein